MKRFFLFLILFISLFSSCKNLSPEYSVQLSIVRSADMEFFPDPPHFQTKQDVVFYCSYHLAPLNSNKDIGDVEVYSTDSDVIEILYVDTENYRITAKTKNTGTAKVKVITENYNSSTSLYILVQ